MKIMVERAVALQQAKALGRGVAEGRDRHMRRIVERPPQPPARAGPDGEAVGIVDSRAPVDRRRLGGFREPVHGGERRDAETNNVSAQEKALVDVHDHAFAKPCASRHGEFDRADDSGPSSRA